MGHHVYKITNTKNGKVYIGKTSIGVESRFKRHCWRSFSSNKKSRNECPKLYRAIRYYGIGYFVVETIGEYDSEEEAIEMEIVFIQKFNSIKKGMNCILGNDHPKTGDLNPMFGQGAKLTGEKNGMFGRTGEMNPFFNKHHTEENKTNASIREAKFSVAELTDMKVMLFVGKSSGDIKVKYPTVSDKILSLLRNGKRFKHIRPDLIIPPIRRAQITFKQANEMRKEFATGKYLTKKAFYEAIKTKIDVIHTTIINILNGKSHKS